MKPPLDKQEEIKNLIPITETPEIVGRLFYSESDQAWSMIRFKKEILQKFTQLKDKGGNFCYRMIMHQNYEELKEAINMMKKSSDSVPLLLFLCKKKIEDVD